MGTGSGTRIPLWISILALAFIQIKGRRIYLLGIFTVSKNLLPASEFETFFLGFVELLNLLPLCKILFSVTNTFFPKKRKIIIFKLHNVLDILNVFSTFEIRHNSYFYHCASRLAFSF